MFKEAMAAYYVIACVEAWSSLQRFPLYTLSVNPEAPFYPITGSSDTRFGSEVEKRLKMAQSLLSLKIVDVYKRAVHLRRNVTTFIKNHYIRSMIITPTAPSPPPRSDTTLPEYDNDIYTVPFSLAGVPVWSLPLNPSKSTKMTFTAAQLVHANPLFIYKHLSRLSA